MGWGRGAGRALAKAPRNGAGELAESEGMATTTENEGAK
jgi:hypothetical protein